MSLTCWFTCFSLTTQALRRRLGLLDRKTGYSSSSLPCRPTCIFPNPLDPSAGPIALPQRSACLFWSTRAHGSHRAHLTYRAMDRRSRWRCQSSRFETKRHVGGCCSDRPALGLPRRPGFSSGGPTAQPACHFHHDPHPARIARSDRFVSTGRFVHRQKRHCPPHRSHHVFAWRPHYC